MAIIVLDRVVAVASATRRVLTGRSDVSRATWVAVVSALGVLVATTVSVIVVLRTPEKLAPVTLNPPPPVDQVGTPPAGTPRAHAIPAVTTAPPAPSGTPTAPPTAGPSTGGPTPSASTTAPVPAALGAEFAIADTALLSYGASVTISNPGRVPVPRWTLAVTLPRESLRVSQVEGARAVQDGAVWTFVPDDDAGQVPAGASVRVTFRVNGATVGASPTACTIDGTTCAGMPD